MDTDDKEEKSDDKEGEKDSAIAPESAKKKVEKEKVGYELENMSRVLPTQLKYISFPGERYAPVKKVNNDRDRHCRFELTLFTANGRRCITPRHATRPREDSTRAQSQESCSTSSSRTQRYRPAFHAWRGGRWWCRRRCCGANSRGRRRGRRRRGTYSRRL